MWKISASRFFIFLSLHPPQISIIRLNCIRWNGIIRTVKFFRVLKQTISIDVRIFFRDAFYLSMLDLKQQFPFFKWYVSAPYPNQGSTIQRISALPQLTKYLRFNLLNAHSIVWPWRCTNEKAARTNEREREPNRQATTKLVDDCRFLV